jgi:hypothetical protein
MVGWTPDTTWYWDREYSGDLAGAGAFIEDEEVHALSLAVLPVGLTVGTGPRFASLPGRFGLSGGPMEISSG